MGQKILDAIGTVLWHAAAVLAIVIASTGCFFLKEHLVVSRAQRQAEERVNHNNRRRSEWIRSCVMKHRDEDRFVTCRADAIRLYPRGK